MPAKTAVPTASTMLRAPNQITGFPGDATQLITIERNCDRDGPFDVTGQANVWSNDTTVATLGTLTVNGYDVNCLAVGETSFGGEFPTEPPPGGRGNCPDPGPPLTTAMPMSVAFLRGSTVSPSVTNDGDNCTAGQAFTFRVEAVNSSGQRETRLNSRVSVNFGTLIAGEVIDPGAIQLNSGVGTTQVTLQGVKATGDIGRDYIITTENGFSSTVTTGIVRVYFSVTMDVERWKNCGFSSCPNLGSYFCGAFCRPYNGSPQPAGPTQPISFMALTAPACDASVLVISARTGKSAETTVKDRGPTTNRPYWTDGNRPSIGGCLTDVLMDSLEEPYGCNPNRGQANVLWRFR